MLRYAAIFLVIAMVAAIYGFSGIAAGASSVGKGVCAVFGALALVATCAGLARP